MANPALTTPSILTDPGFLYIAPLGSTLPTNTVAGGVFTDTWPVAWLPYGATEEGSTFNYEVEVEKIEVAELFDAVAYRTTSRDGSIEFNLASWTATNYRRALNGGVAPVTATSGTGATALYTVEPPAPGAEVRAMIGWESTDSTVRLVCHQTLQGGSIESSFSKAPDLAFIPVSYQLEVTSAGKTFTIYTAGTTRA